MRHSAAGFTAKDADWLAANGQKVTLASGGTLIAGWPPKSLNVIVIEKLIEFANSPFTRAWRTSP